MNDTNLNDGAATMLRGKDEDIKVVMVKIPPDQYLEVKQKQTALAAKFAANGDASNLTMNAFVLAALKAFRVE
jgi:hypothetical protein